MAILEANTDLDVKGKVLATDVPNSTGSVVTWNANTNVFGLRTNAQIISDLNLSSNFVPYTGATANVNLGTRSITSTGGFLGNATTASTLATARTINGTSFNGSANITTARWGTARNITIGNTTKSVNGSANVSWSLAEIGVNTGDFVPYTGADQPINFNTQDFTTGGYTNRLHSYFERIDLASDSVSDGLGNFKLLTNVAAAEMRNTSLTSDIIITLPITTTTHWQAEIDILRSGYRTTLNIGGYSTSNANRFVNVVYGNIDDILEVKFGRIGDSTVLIIKRNSSSTNRLQVNISKFYYHHSNSVNLYNDKTKYKVEYINESELVDFTLNGVVVNSQFIRDSYLDFRQYGLGTEAVTNTGLLENINKTGFYAFSTNQQGFIYPIAMLMKRGSQNYGLIFQKSGDKVGFLTGDGSTYTAWHSGNFNPAQYVLNTQLANYLPLSGGTMTGAITHGSGTQHAIIKNMTGTSGGYNRGIINLQGSDGTIGGLYVYGTGDTIAGLNYLHFGIGEYTTSHSGALYKFGRNGLAIGLPGSASPADALYVNGSIRFASLNSAGFVKTSANGTLSVDTNTYALSSALSSYVPTSRTITAGNGLSGGGTLAANRTLTLGTPSAITLSSTNSVTDSSHTHAFNPGGTTAQYIRGDGSLATMPTFTNTITRLRGTTSGTYTSGDLTLLAGANTTITQSGANITISSTNTNTWREIKYQGSSGSVATSILPTSSTALTLKAGSNLEVTNEGSGVVRFDSNYYSGTVDDITTGSANSDVDAVWSGKVLASAITSLFNSSISSVSGFIKDNGITTIGSSGITIKNTAGNIIDTGGYYLNLGRTTNFDQISLRCQYGFLDIADDILELSYGYTIIEASFSTITFGYDQDITVRGANITLDPKGVVTSTKQVSAPAFYETSLRKFKENIVPLEKSGLELVNSLEIVRFDRKSEGENEGIKNKIGVIADDTDEEFLSEEKNSIDIYKTLFIQAKAIQELSEKNEILENKINDLEELIKKMMGE